MATTTVTPLMGLILPIPEIEIGPAWANELVSAFDQIDSHDHTSGKGAAIPLSALTINANVDLFGFAVENFLYSSHVNNATPIAGSVTNALYVAGGELYYNDNSGNQIKLTSLGGINLTSIGTIGGDYSTSTASVSYSSLAETFTFTSDTSIYAKVNVGDFKIFDRIIGGNYVELKTPSGLGASYSLTFPISLPALTLPVQMSLTGVLSTNKITTNQIEPLNITTALIGNSQVTDLKLASNAVTTAKILDLNVTTAKIGNSQVTDLKLASNAVTTAKILDGNVTTAKILDLNVTTAKIGNSQVTDLKLASNAVTTAKILDGNVTPAKLAAAPFAEVAYSTGGTTGTGVLIAPISFIHNGRPLIFNVYSEYLDMFRSAGTVYCTVRIYRNSVLLLERYLASGSANIIGGNINMVIPYTNYNPAGSTLFQIQFYFAGFGSMGWGNGIFTIYEL